MKVEVKPSDLYFRYQRKKRTRELPKFSGKPDKESCDRDDLYEVIPMFEAVLAELGSNDQAVLQRAEELLDQLPRFIDSREMVFDALVEGLRDMVGAW
ncbi:hypothetical protein C2E25_15095 [Geothermobacter hydrogeniphilus]|uniref:Uncharacterized protein n=1 Tax=Geothermobacter hydrogeniphilus TaxID=1969733 RepID=A0A2K2H6S6_9BACT|nr:hypothetical protein [Geothermobacter hydrogeniphilus]PNU18950.1 hypothetical protein C2E25_15095 [Geothermobacter hydrogeniphilus]